MPSLSSVLLTEKPRVPFSTTNAVIPRCALAWSVWAKTRAKDASRPVLMKSLRPVSTQPSPSRRASVCWLRASEPASGSVSAKQPSAWPEATGVRNRCRCSSVPYFSTGSQ